MAVSYTHLDVYKRQNKITSWVSATGGTYGTAMTVATRNRIKAVRVAVVSRNPKAENADVSASCSFTTDAGLVVDLSGDANCKRYHYSVYETIIPLRNMIWSKDPPPPAPLSYTHLDVYKRQTDYLPR